MSIAEGAIIGGKLRLERPLAKGGMGAVWVARHQLLDTNVAVKFMEGSIAANESLRQRFEREAKAAALIKSPHVVQVLDYGVEDGTPYIVMELLEGEDLGTRLERGGRLDLTEAYRILEPLGKALRRAHDLGIVHRDLKPGNVFLARSGDDEIVKVLDFGIAKDVTITGPATSTSSGMMLGSPSYMSPEQIRETKQVDHRSDLWSIGVILYEAITGRLPFDEAENIGKLLVTICTDHAPPPSSLVPSLDPAVDRFFERALARDKAARFQSMAELVEAFGLLVGIRANLRSRPSIEIVPSSGRAVDARTNKLGTDVTVAAPMTLDGDRASSPRASAPDPRSTLSPAESGARASSSRRFVPVVLGAAVALAIGAGLILTQASKTGADASPEARGASAPPAGISSQGGPAVAPVEALRSARLLVTPPDAQVEVNGRSAPVDHDGYVTIHGALGSTHALRIHKDGRETRVEVAITANGALPDKLKLEEDETKLAQTSAKPKAGAPPASAAPAAGPATTTAPVTTVAHPVPKPTVTTPSKDPQPVRTFE
ncbi:serine/threonine-protein kinase [Polyangium jinanense]|uniref:Serine/threonine protein kinase n=1 Tax=Polyangium jinanense TaxID=2829994 RepID=A0A9X3X559_9BACT|nr:serine/threonine-protein kinase [Polyangium jinanense]MDC3955726.1 serine/threonine protein kinase [Polyangium jinanense]MDC3982368.1 serine/threonine protein kinase [Polyangium jinanense]